MNPRLARLEPYPFAKLHALFADLRPGPQRAIALSVAVVSSCLVGEAPATGGDSVCGLSDCAGSAGASAADAGLALTLSIAVVVAETGSLGATSLG